MSNTPHLVDPVHLFDERGHALSSYDVQAARIAALEAENHRLRENMKRINLILAKSRAAQAEKPPARLH